MCRVKVQSNDDEQAVCFVPRVAVSDHELAFSETVSSLKRGRTNYVVVDVLNDTKKELLLSKGEIIGSVHSVSAVMPLVNVGRWNGGGRTAHVSSVSGGNNAAVDNLEDSSDDGDGSIPEVGSQDKDCQTHTITHFST